MIVSRHRLALPILAGWTVLLWASRIRNILADEDLSTGGRFWRIVIAAGFIALGGFALWAWRQRGDRPERAIWSATLLCGWTIVFWLARGGGIIIDDHSLGFTLIHSALMVASIALAVWAWPRRSRSTAPLDTAV